MCVYENVCWQNFDQLVLMSNSKAGRVPATMRKSSRIDFPTKLFWDMKQDVQRVRPAQYHIRDASYVTPAAVEELNKAGKVMWANKTLHIPTHQDRLSNIWYFSSRLLPVFSTQYHRDILNIPPITPGESEFVMLAGADKTKLKFDWHKQMFDAVLPPEDKVPRYFDGEPPYNGMRITGANQKWKYVCAKKAVIYGGAQYAFPDWLTAWAFRRHVYARNNLTVPTRPPMSVTILDRPRTAPRHMFNPQDVRDLVKKYGHDPNYVVWEHTSFHDQVEMLSRTGVFISIHGAGIMNEIFLPPGSVVIEIFPVHVKHVLYERIAHYMGVYHFKVYATALADKFADKYKTYFEHDCDKYPALETPLHKDCWQYMKNPAVVVPIPDLEVALANALDFIASGENKAVYLQRGDVRATAKQVMGEGR